MVHQSIYHKRLAVHLRRLICLMTHFLSAVVPSQQPNARLERHLQQLAREGVRRSNDDVFRLGNHIA